MTGEARFRFLMSHDEAPDALSSLGVGPEQVMSLHDGAYIGLHLLPVTDGDAAHFASRNHRRNDGQELGCFSVLARSLQTTALAGHRAGFNYAVVDAGYVARMACICDRLTPVITAGNSGRGTQKFDRDNELTMLLRRFKAPSWSEADAVAKGFPDIFSTGNPFGGYMVFQDLIRLIWVHEWAHIMLGHSEIWSDFVSKNGFPEHAETRDESLALAIEDVPWSLALQTFELQADQFATSFISKQILYGWDPAAQLAGPNIDLVQRLAVFAAACAVFAVDSYLVQGERDPAFASHPGATLRYMTMLHTIQEVAFGYQDPRLASAVRLATFGTIMDLSQLAGDFHGLLTATPMVAETPLYKSLCKEQDFLMTGIGGKLAELRKAYTYFPTSPETN